MKKSIKTLLVVMMLNILFGMTSLADENMEWRESPLLPENIHYSIGYGHVGRGDYLSSALISITNEGHGSIGIMGNTLCHVPVKKIRMAIYLDCWDEIQKKWIQVDYYNFTYEDKEGEKDLTAATETFSVIGLPTNCYYRLRGFICVWPFSGGSEMQGPVTEGILITDGAV